jgi:CSLREA domain-containing protein
MKTLTFSRIVFSILAVSICVNIASASNCRVNKTADTNDGVCDGADCSLREAVAEPACSTIDFSLDLAGHPVGLTLGEIVINRSLSITAFGADAFTISGNDLSRIFFVPADKTVNISGLTLKGGNGVGAEFPNEGGAILSLGAINLNGVVLTQNSVCSSCTGAAVSIKNPATTSIIRNSTVQNNPAGPSNAAAISINGGGPLGVYNSTLTLNPGPAIKLLGAPVKVVQSTVDANGMGVFINGLGSLTAADSIVTDVCRCHMLSGFSSEGFNIVSTTPGSNQISYQKSDLVNIDPLLGPLDRHGGLTFSYSLRAGSPALDGGSNSLAAFYSLTADQRGFARIFDGDGDGTTTVDIGSFESNSPAPAQVVVAGRVLTAAGSPVRGVAVYLTDFQGSSARYAVSSSLGWFYFDQLPAGRVYKVRIASKRQPSQERNVFADHDLTDVDITLP